MPRLCVCVILAGVLLAACQQAPTAPPQAVASTPAQSLQLLRAQVSTPVGSDIIDSADAEYLLLTNIYERLAPSVVNIEVSVTRDNSSVVIDVGRGSGFVYDAEGHIVTNAHVIANARDIIVTFNDGYLTSAELVGTDAFSDLAVLRVEISSERLHPVVIADSDTVRVGQRAITIGNPFGLASSMTQGIVSGLGRQLPSAQLLDADLPPGFSNPAIIQVDAEINPGNSGGPLLNSQGEVIGVNTAIQTESGMFQGVGFAIPANTVRRVVPELIETGAVAYSWLGISTRLEDEGYGVTALAEALNLPVDAGVLIDQVWDNSPAAKAELRAGDRVEVVRGESICAGGDIIVAANGHYVRNLDELVAYLVVNTHPGDVVQLLIVRGDQSFEVPVTLETRPTSDTGIARNGC